MPVLIRFILSNFAIGFALGTLAAITLIALRHGTWLTGDLNPIAIWLQIFAIGAPFGLGCLGTALLSDAEE